MAPLDIHIYGDPILRERAREVTPEDLTEDFRRLLEDMRETMYAANGIGLAANQVGEVRRVFVADWEQSDGPRRGGKRPKDPARRHFRIFLNPVILSASEEDEEGNEGCLSIPEVEADVYRPKRIRLRYRDLDWQEHEEAFDGLAARVIQHELDHLDGVLFIDRLPEDVRRGLAGALNRLKRRAREEAPPPSPAPSR